MPNVKLTISVDDKFRRAFAMRADRLGISQAAFFSRFVGEQCKEELSIIEGDFSKADKEEKKSKRKAD